MKESKNMYEHRCYNWPWHLIHDEQTIPELDQLLDLYPMGLCVYDELYHIRVYFLELIGQRADLVYRSSNQQGRRYSVYGVDWDIVKMKRMEQRSDDNASTRKRTVSKSRNKQNT